MVIFTPQHMCQMWQGDYGDGSRSNYLFNFSSLPLLENDKKKQVLKLVLQRVVRTDLRAGAPTELGFCLAELTDLH